MIVPVVTPELAERSLIGAAVHAFSARAHSRANPTDQTDLEFARQIPKPDELAESATVYAISLVWWAHQDLHARRELLDAATALMLAYVDDDARERPFEAGYRIFATQLVQAALVPRVDAEIDLRPLLSGVTEIDLMTARFADTAAHALLLTDRETFGDPAQSAETMRDEMIQLAFCSRAA
ncbi:hypothetical protein SAMN05444157_1002 [Frankineae bacterium MT45]|nr:hypothetical protein SAMN05444157_1002 [Frankineae bacterium MT45]